MSFPEGASTARVSSALWSLGSESVPDPTQYHACEIYTFGAVMIVVDALGRFVTLNVVTNKRVRSPNKNMNRKRRVA